MILYIAEKPSLGRAIADALPGPHKKTDGAIELGNGDVVSWCIGHLLEQAEPDAYDPKYKKWSRETLPILPQRWQLTPKPKTRKQLSVLRKLVKQADHLVHAGDPDREGQLLVDEVIDYLGVSKTKKSQVQRCLISDLNRPAVVQALASLRSNQEFAALSISALARSRADWLYGLNMTRAYTLQGQQAGYQGVLSVGRVQTPLLGLVVRRDNEIDQFVAHDFFDVWAQLQTASGECFKAKWLPSDSCAKFLDDQGRNLSRPLADNVAGRITGKPAEVTALSRQKKQRAAPLPHSLSSLQIDASKAFGLSAQQVLDVCQALYETHKLITYPRSDSRHLPKAHFAQGASVTACLVENMATLGVAQFAGALADADFNRKSRAWNDAKVDAHHAIIPTLKKIRRLSETESKVYQLVCRNYMAQFLAPEHYSETKVEVKIDTGLFNAKAREQQLAGWTVLFPKKAGAKARDSGKNSGDDSDGTVATLPTLTKGQALTCTQGEVVAKQTSPPKAFTDATLLAAMTGISRFVADPELRRVLKETDGLGTEATRAGIIELLFKRGFLVRSGKVIRSTEAGKVLIQALPTEATWPDMTARWESELDAICNRQSKYAHFMEPMVESLHGLIDQSQRCSFASLKGLGDKKRKPYRRKRAASNAR